MSEGGAVVICARRRTCIPRGPAPTPSPPPTRLHPPIRTGRTRKKVARMGEVGDSMVVVCVSGRREREKDKCRV